MDEAKGVTLPAFREFSGKNLLQAAMSNDLVMEYLPDKDELKP